MKRRVGNALKYAPYDVPRHTTQPDIGRGDVKGVEPFVLRDTDIVQIIFARNPIRSDAYTDADTRETLTEVARLVGDEPAGLYAFDNIPDYGRAVPMSCLMRRPDVLKKYFECVAKTIDEFCKQFVVLGFGWDLIPQGDQTFTIRYVSRGNMKGVSKVAKVHRSMFTDLDRNASGCDDDDEDDTNGMAYQLYLFVNHDMTFEVIKSRKVDERGILRRKKPKTFCQVEMLNINVGAALHPETHVDSLWSPSWGGVCRLGYCHAVAQGEPEYDVHGDNILFPLLYNDIGKWVLE